MKRMILPSVVLFIVSCRALPDVELQPWSGESNVQDVAPEKPLPQPVMTDNSATERRKSVPTRFYASELVREPVVVDGKPGFRLILRGNATIVHDDTTLRAPVIYLDPGNEGRLVGGVTITDRNQGITLRAAEGTYSRAREFVSIEGLPRLEIRQGGRPVLVTTNVLRRDLAEKKSYMDGDVRMHGQKWSLLADQAVLSDDTGMMLLEKEPVLIGQNVYMSGGNIEYWSREQKVVLQDRPFARLIVEESRQNKQEESEDKEQAARRVPYDLSAGRIEYRLEDKGEALLTGNVSITSEVRSLYGERFKLSGEGLSFIEADRGVKLVDTREKMELRARLMRYDTKKRWLWLSGTPVVELYEKNGTGLRARLEAAVIERDMDREIALARGNVHLQRKSEQAVAEIAVFREKEQTMDLTGRPFLLRGGVWVRCKKIRMLSDPDRIVFEEDLSAGVR